MQTARYALTAARVSSAAATAAKAMRRAQAAARACRHWQRRAYRYPPASGRRAICRALARACNAAAGRAWAVHGRAVACYA